MATILIVDDEEDMRELLRFRLERAGHAVLEAVDGLDAVTQLKGSPKPDCVVLDLMMPNLDGFQVLKKMRRKSSLQKIPVVVVTARSAVEDRIKGLEKGADDYVTKPFSTKEVLLRIQNVLRRGGEGGGPSEVVVGPLSLSIASMLLTRGGEEAVNLTVTEFKLLRLLMERSGQTQPRDELLREVWGYSDTTITRTLDTHIKRLREKLGPSASLLETVRGLGYRLNASA
ncbi:MAG: response regulator transcription factor [Verrucomicrobiota bacterium]